MKIVSLLCALLMFPAVALAQDGRLSEGGLPLAPILAIATALAAVIGAVTNVIPAGWRTHANTAAAALAGIVIPALTDLSATGEKATLMALALALIGAVIGRVKAGKPAPAA